MSTRNGEGVECPFCGNVMGDAWEWCNSESPREQECDECEKVFVCWAEYSVDYIARVPLTEREKEVLRSAK